MQRSFSGVVSPNEESNLGLKTGGEIIIMNVEDGQKVRKGDLIAEVEPHDFQVQYNTAETAFKNTQSMLERFEKLYARQAVSQHDYEMAKTNYTHAKASLESATQ